MPQRETLEVPAGPNPIERRLNLHAPCNQPPTGKPAIGPVPPSSVLGKLQQFMPRMQEANQELERQLQGANTQSFDIEAVEEGQEGGYIEMDLTCGLFDLKNAEAIRAAEQALANGRSEQGNGEASSDSESTSDEEDSSDSSDSQSSGQPEQQPQPELPSVSEEDAGRHSRRRRSALTAGANTVASAAGAEPMDASAEGLQQHQRRRLKTKRTPKISEL